jgi:lysophospholipase L1-like esterase
MEEGAVLHAEALRGAAWPGDAQTPYPRADPLDLARLPGDTWGTAELPVGVRLEFVGDAKAVEIDYTCLTEDLGYRGAGAGTSFLAWRGEQQVGEEVALFEGGTAVLPLEGVDGAADGQIVTIYLPEGMRPTIFEARPVDGTLEPAPRGPRWLAYGDSITEGWVASGPPHCWPAVAARKHGLDVVNLGYAGSARGEIATAEQISALDADVISLAYGTNCWTRTPHSAEMFRAGLQAFLAILRQGHPETPIVVASAVIRPDAESTPNRLGATLADLRAETEVVVERLQQAGETQLHLVRGLPLLTADLLADGVHPADEGHRLLATGIGDVVARVAGVAGAATVLDAAVQ